MKAYHNSRNEEYRRPYGAVALGEPVALAIDVVDAPEASVVLRTWVDGEGEALYPMTPTGPVRHAGDEHSGVSAEAVRHEATLDPGSEGVVWYHFIIDDGRGGVFRYGARDGRFGGEGQLRDWEPPSFQLSVRRRPEVPGAWPRGICYDVIPDRFFRDGNLTPAFDYLDSLGVGAILLRPPIRGDIDLASVCTAAQERGIRVVADGRLGLDGYEALDALDDCAKRDCGKAVVAFLRNEATAFDVLEAMETLRENEHGVSVRHALNVLGDSGTVCLLSQLGGAPAPAELPPEQRRGYRTPDDMLGLAKGRLWCASLIQMLAAETPLVRYGDEAGMEGYAGPEGPGTFPWGREDQDCEAIVRNVMDVRNTLPLFEEGSFQPFAANGDVFGFWRFDDQGVACILVNASLSDAHDVYIPLAAAEVSDVLGGAAVEVVAEADPDGPVAPACARQKGRREGYARLRLNQVGSAILYFHPHERLQRSMEPGLGVLAHITSLPSGAGDDGSAPAREADVADAAAAGREPDEQLAHCMEAVEAVLENAGISVQDAIAKAAGALSGAASDPVKGHPGTLGAPARRFVDMLSEAGVRYWQVLPANPTDGYGSPYAGISAFAGNVRLLEGSPAAIVRELATMPASDEYRAFCEREKDWLDPYAGFMAIRWKLDSEDVWQEWPERYRRYDPQVIGSNAELSFYAEAWRRSQFAFDRQWRELRAYANERGVQIIGDMPIYVSADSSDVWANPGIFQLGADGMPQVVAGCPPDSFAPEGQVWGNPVYNWKAVADSGYAWWLRRLERAFELYDWVRLDHFIGFARYFSIPADGKAADGSYRPGPGIDLFRAAHDKFGPLPVIAEDLGAITPSVRVLGTACGFPGMDIVQFADGNDPLSGYAPRPEKIAYTGTHDNQTLLGYVRSRYGDSGSDEAAAKIMDMVASSAATVTVVPLQDVLGLGDEARMNVPGVAEGNWVWQAQDDDLKRAPSVLRNLAALRPRDLW